MVTTILQATNEELARFWDKVEIPKSPDACWVWIAARNRKGYGDLSFRGRRYRAHRLSFELANGSIPDGLQIHHTCDNPPCVRPQHLWAGSALENTADMIAKGRGWFGGLTRDEQWKSQYQPTVELTAARFWAHVQKAPGDQCWLWDTISPTARYGRLGVGGKQVAAHRLAYELVHGSIPAGLYVCHICDTPACVRPSHLFLGTALENNQDSQRKGRRPSGANHPRRKNPEPWFGAGRKISITKKALKQAQGESNPNARLSKKQVQEIRQRYNDRDPKLRGPERLTQQKLADEFGVSKTQITRVTLGLSWK